MSQPKRFAVYITRGDHWSFESRDLAPITPPEWLDYVRQDSELEPVECFSAFDSTGRRIGSVSAQRFWRWTKYSQYNIEDAKGTFEYHRNGIIVRDPDDELLQKAKDVARALRARVIGDDDVLY